MLISIKYRDRTLEYIEVDHVVLPPGDKEGFNKNVGEPRIYINGKLSGLDVCEMKSITIYTGPGAGTYCIQHPQRSDQ